MQLLLVFLFLTMNDCLVGVKLHGFCQAEIVSEENSYSNQQRQPEGESASSKSQNIIEAIVELETLPNSDIKEPQISYSELNAESNSDVAISENIPQNYVETDDIGANESSRSEEIQGENLKPKVLMEALGLFTEEDDSASHEQRKKNDAQEDDLWTDKTDDRNEKRRSSGRHFFSLMNLVKFLLNPVIEEFQEVEKNPEVNSFSKNTSSQASETEGKEQSRNHTDTGKKTKFQCIGRNVTENTTAEVRTVNSTVLLEVLSFDKNHTQSDCVLVMFFAPWCHFCAATAPHYNAIGRAFPQLEVLAVDTVHFSNLNARFGTVAVPNIMLFHQSRSAVRFNHTERHFDTLIQFVKNTTGLEPNETVVLSDMDYVGPLSSVPSEETDYLLILAWIFVIICSGHWFIQSHPGQCVIEKVRILWQEHQHIE